MKSVAVITGGSSGIGLAAAAALRDSGCTVYELSRHSAGTHGINHLDADVSEEEQVRACIDEILEKENRIDIVVNCAGMGISGAAEFTDSARAARLLEVNLFGVDNVCKAVIPVMRVQGCGRIINISSLAALAPVPFQSWYSASKAAVSAYTRALANELKPFGISVCALLPGDTNTGFTAARLKDDTGDDIYEGRISRSVTGMEKSEHRGMSADFAGEYVAKIALQKKVRPEYAVGNLNKVCRVLLKILPCSFSNWLLYQLYARSESIPTSAWKAVKRLTKALWEKLKEALKSKPDKE